MIGGASITAVATLNGVSHQLPTFYLNPNVQGITRVEGARKIAYAILDPFGDKQIAVHASEVWIDGGTVVHNHAQGE